MERWDVLDENGNFLHRTMERGDRFGAGEYHLVVHIFPINHKGEVLIQRRALDKAQLPGCWYLTAGSAVSGEQSHDAALRECREELGLAMPPEEMHFLARVRNWHSISDLYWFLCDTPPEEMNIQTEELSEVKFVSPQEFRRIIFNDQYNQFLSEDYRQAVWQLLMSWQERLSPSGSEQ